MGLSEARGSPRHAGSKKEHFKTLNKSLGKGCAVGAIAVPLQGKRGSPGFGDLSLALTGHLPAWELCFSGSHVFRDRLGKVGTVPRLPRKFQQDPLHHS